VHLGNTAAAREAFRAAISDYPAFLPAYHNLALLLLREGRPEIALDVYKEAIRNNPDNPMAYYVAGNFLLKTGTAARDFRDAAGYLGRAVFLRPRDSNARGALGMALMRLGKTRDAEASLREALRLDPGNRTAGQLLDILLRAKAGAPSGK